MNILKPVCNMGKYNLSFFNLVLVCCVIKPSWFSGLFTHPNEKMHLVLLLYKINSYFCFSIFLQSLMKRLIALWLVVIHLI